MDFMAKKLASGLTLKGVAPNILLSHVINTAPFIFEGEVNTEGKERSFLKTLCFYKSNLKALQKINLTEYFKICMAAHWSTAGTFVPTNVDNQIREGLWRHGEIGAHIQMMSQITIDSWKWDYSEVTNRKAYNQNNSLVMSTHEGTWLSVAIGAYCACLLHKQPKYAKDLEDVILAEVKKEEEILLYLYNSKDYLNFLRAIALMAHNFGDLDRVMEQWKMDEDSSFFKQIYKLGHKPNANYDSILFRSGELNKKTMALENHRHMSMRAVKNLRLSKDFLIPVGPFMDNWGKNIAISNKLSLQDKAEFVLALNEGYSRQDMAYGYPRAFHGLLENLEGGINAIEAFIPHDVMLELKKSTFWSKAQVSQGEFEDKFIKDAISQF